MKTTITTKGRGTWRLFVLAAVLAVFAGCGNPWMRSILAPFYPEENAGYPLHMTVYVDPGGNDNNNGLSPGIGNALETVDEALLRIKQAYSAGSWPGRGGSSPPPAAAKIIIEGTITAGSGTDGMVDISDGGIYAAYPPIILAGTGPGELDATTMSKRVLYVENADVTLESGLELFGGNDNDGGGVYVTNGKFTMNGGFIRNNSTTASGGGGVFVTNNGIFNMNGGTIENHISITRGGGVYVHSGQFNMSGDAKILNNTVSDDGGGVYVHSGNFNMSGGTIGGSTTPNTANHGAGVYISGGNFSMSGDAKIHYNEITPITGGDGGGVYFSGSGNFSMSGNASISYNLIPSTSSGSGGGVYAAGGGTFDMNGGTISGNTANNNGGGVYITNSGNFTKSGGFIYGSPDSSQNTAVGGSGHAVFFNGAPGLNKDNNVEPSHTFNGAIWTP
ncbi:MAG: hypothetical protein LBH35_08560 [Treponema sp.]|jgi:parallel beta-helix repeat protein|nr:hypothetical protein [Treponema sp.]